MIVYKIKLNSLGQCTYSGGLLPTYTTFGCEIIEVEADKFEVGIGNVLTLFIRKDGIERDSRYESIAAFTNWMSIERTKREQ